MNRTRTLFFLLAAWSLAAGVHGADDGPPEAQKHLLTGVLWMQRAPEYGLLSQSVFQAAGNALPAAIAAPGSAAKEQSPLPASAPAAVIVDLDETMLDNSRYQAYLVSTGKGYQDATWDQWMALQEARAVPGAVDFANAVMKSGRATIFYVSNRTCGGDHLWHVANASPGLCPAKAATMQNMKRLGFPRYDDPDAFLFRGEQTDPRADKVTRRARIGAEYRIVMLLGDDMRDFLSTEDADLLAKGDPGLAKMAAELIGRRWFVLPNAMYGSWVDRLGKSPAQWAAQLDVPKLPVLTLATWNLEWLMTPATFAELSGKCVSGGNPPSDVRALPCPGQGHPPVKARGQSGYEGLHAAARELDADVVALQEVDGPEAARLVFRTGWALDCFTRRAHPQKVGFAIRAGIPYRCNGDFTELDVDGTLRAGADVTLYPGTRGAVRLLGVHLKSGCARGPLDAPANPNCAGLRRQIPVLKRWIDARAVDGVPYAVLGDFNRWLDGDAKYGAGADPAMPTSVFRAIDDGQPGGMRMVRATSGMSPVKCWPTDTHAAEPIDNILVSDKLLGAQHIRASRVVYGTELSDHCPLQAKIVMHPR